MVEKHITEIKDLNKAISRFCGGVSHSNLESDIYKLLLRKECSNLEGSEMIRIILMNSDDEIICWNRATYGEVAIETIEYEKWKSKLVNGFKQDVSMLNFIQSRQKDEESVYDFFKRIESGGKILKLKECNILDIVRNCLRKDSLLVKSTIACERKFSENLYEKLKDLDIVIKDKKVLTSKHKKKNVKKDAIYSKTKVNNITAGDLVNKDNLIYINNQSYSVLFDTGAEENYISYLLVKKVEATVLQIQRA